jgi:large subunit ribosomal protein L43
VLSAKTFPHPAVHRRFAEELLVPFAKANPQLDICISMKANKHPLIRGFYFRDPEKTLSLRNLSAQQVAERVQFLRDSRPMSMRKWAKPFRTTPSIQGVWELGQQLNRPHRTIRA